MTKKLLLTAVAVGALGFAGAASAQSADRFFGYRTAVVGDPANAISDDDTAAGPAGPNRPAAQVGTFLLANEIASTSLAAGTLLLTDNLGDGNAIPSGNNLYTIRLTNATFGSSVTSANFVGLDNLGNEVPANCTITVSTGGGDDDVQVELLVSSTGAGSCSGFNIDLPVQPDAVGNVTVTANLRTETGNPIDGGLLSLNAISLVDAFQPTFNGTFTANGADGDTFTPLPDYNTITPDGVLGRAALYVDEEAHFSLNPADDVDVAQVDSISFRVEGNFNAFNGTGAADVPTLGGVSADSASTTEVNFVDASQIVEPLATKPAGSPFEVEADGAVIQASDYEAFIDYDLDAVYQAQPEASSESATAAGPIFGTPFESIEREGTNVLLPWMNSAATAAQTGTNNIVRLSNTGSVAVRVTADVLTSSNPAYDVDDGIVFIGNIPAGGELVLTAAELAVLGDFARGDVQMIIEGDSELITVKRYAILANGSVTEFESGSVASDQNVVLVP